MPGGFDDAPTPDDRSESNIRYGRDTPACSTAV
jgi:hypothetical protein